MLVMVLENNLLRRSYGRQAKGGAGLDMKSHGYTPLVFL